AQNDPTNHGELSVQMGNHLLFAGEPGSRLFSHVVCLWGLMVASSKMFHTVDGAEHKVVLVNGGREIPNRPLAGLLRRMTSQYDHRHSLIGSIG
ncbi:MAG: hypothetical protein M0Z36_13735, partial [Thermaerobacter sp.]|nr:hypothetical protein [Thermaerobacter sp.]